MVDLLIETNRFVETSQLDEMRVYWCTNAMRLNESGGFLDMIDHIGPICIENITTILKGDKDLFQRREYVLFAKELAEYVEISEEQAKIIASEEEEWDVNDPSFDVQSVRNAHALLLTVSNGCFTDDEWIGQIKDRKITVVGVPRECDKFIAIVTSRNYLEFKATFLKAIQTEISVEVLKQEAKEYSVLQFIQETAKQLLDEHRSRFDEDKEENAYMRTSVLGHRLFRACQEKWKNIERAVNDGLKWKKYIRTVLEKNGISECLEEADYGNNIVFRPEKKDSKHWVRLRDPTVEKWTGREWTRTDSQQHIPEKPLISQWVIGKLVEHLVAEDFDTIEWDTLSKRFTLDEEELDEIKTMVQEKIEEEEIEEEEEEKWRRIDPDVQAISIENLKFALDKISGGVRQRQECEDWLTNEGEIGNNESKRIVKLFENSPYSPVIGNRTKNAWIKHLRFTFKNKFSEHPRYEKLIEILDELDS